MRDFEKSCERPDLQPIANFSFTNRQNNGTASSVGRLMESFKPGSGLMTDGCAFKRR